MSGMSEPLEQLETDLQNLRKDMDSAFSGNPRDRQSQKDSVYGRLDTLEGDVADLKTAAEKADSKEKENAARVEKYRAGFFLALLGSVATWIVTRLTGGS